REHRAGLAFRLQRLAAPPREMLRPQRRVDLLRLVRLGERREAHDLPRLLRQHMARQIVLVQSVHDQDDRTRELVVEPAVEGLVSHSSAVWRWDCDGASSGLNGSRMMRGAAPPRVSPPPTEVASRQPCAVVSNSGIAARCGESRVAKIRRYQPLAT